MFRLSSKSATSLNTTEDCSKLHFDKKKAPLLRGFFFVGFRMNRTHLKVGQPSWNIYRLEARATSFEYIEVFYNRQLRHSELGTNQAEFKRLTHS